MAREEIFGPVASLMRFDTDDEAVRIANATEYGLTAAICTRDEVRAAKLARRLEVGMVFVNNYTRRTFIGSPFGGVKGSGFGREYGPRPCTSSCGPRTSVSLPAVVSSLPGHHNGTDDSRPGLARRDRRPLLP